MTTQQKIILVEDDLSMIQAIQRLLQAAGFQSLPFSSAEALLQSGSVADASCFVLDIHLPGLSGFELWQRLLESGVKRPVIFITAHDEASTQEAANRSGAVACLLKPFPGQRLLAAIRKALDLNARCSTSTD